MQITLARISSFSGLLRSLIWLAGFSALQACSAFEQSSANIKSAELTFRVHQSCVFPVFGSKCIPVSFSGSAPQVSAGAEEWLVVGGKRFQDANGHEFFILYSSSPSRPKSDGKGYCGSGIESKASLWEIDYRKQRAVYRDEILLESCLNNLALNMASEKEFINYLKIADPAEWRVEWIDHPRFGAGQYSVRVESGRLSIAKVTTD